MIRVLVCLTSLLFVVYFNGVQGLACKSTMSAGALSEGTQRKSDGTAPLVRHGSQFLLSCEAFQKKLWAPQLRAA